MLPLESRSTFCHYSNVTRRPHRCLGLFMSEPKVEASTPSRPYPEDRTTCGDTKLAGSMSTYVEVGTRLGPYQLLDKLGEGAMGAVYKARHTRLDRLVALKVLPHYVLSRPDALARFDREMKAVGKLHHPNVVQPLDAGEYAGVHYLSMEYADGQDLNAVVKSNGPVSIVDACKVIRQAALGLAAAHKQGLVHRDIKPSNLFRTKDTGQIKILDLGLALLSVDETSDALTSTGQCFGTPDYMAPEQWDDAHSCDGRTDLYALGCTFFVLLVGRPPYAGEAYPTVKHKRAGHIRDPIPDLVLLRPDIPAKLVAIYQKLMAKRAEDRFASADELAEALRAFENDNESVTVPDSGIISAGRDGIERSDAVHDVPVESQDGALDRLTHPSGRTAAAAAPHDPTSTWRRDPLQNGSPPLRRSRQWRLTAAGAAAVAFLAVIIITITKNNGTTTKIEIPVPEDSQVQIITEDAPALKPQWYDWPADAPSAAIAPFDGHQARAFQNAWANYSKIPVEFTNSLGMKFSMIPPGEFQMGSSSAEIDELLERQSDGEWKHKILREGPRHRVALTKPLYFGMFEVTQHQYSQIMAADGYEIPDQPADAKLPENDPDVLDRKHHPVHDVTWINAVNFCITLSIKENLRPNYIRTGDMVKLVDGNGYRLPTEAEWEFACRTGTTTRWYSTEQPQELLSFAWLRDTSEGRTHAVGGLLPNAFGLHDMHGNVWEYCQDYYGSYAGAATSVDPTGPMIGEFRVIRGASWYDDSEGTRCANRGWLSQTHSLPSVGFRVVKVAGPTPPQVPVALPPVHPEATTTGRVPAE